MRPVHTKSKEEILDIAIPLFAESGYSAVSMRIIAQKVGISAAALYHHFPNKQSLYLAAMTQVFANKSTTLLTILNSGTTPEKRFSQFIGSLCDLVHQDNNFNRLLQREMMDGDEFRLRLLATEVYHDVFQGVIELCRDLGVQKNHYLFAVSILGVVMFHFQTAAIRPYLPKNKEFHSDPQVIAMHVTQLLLKGLITGENK